MSAFVKKNSKESLLHFDRAVVANPRYAPALAGRAEVLLATGEHEKRSRASKRRSRPIRRSRPAQPTQVLRFREPAGGHHDGPAAGRDREASTRRARRIVRHQRIPAESVPAQGAGGGRTARGQRGASRSNSARKAVELEPDEPRTHVLLGEMYEKQGDFARAAEAFSTAVTLQPDPALSAKIEALRSAGRVRRDACRVPGHRSDPHSHARAARRTAGGSARRLLTQADGVNAVVITDTRANWASPYILAVARAGVMEVYPNHTFQPDAVVRRVDIAQAASRVLELIAARNPQLAASWRDARKRKFPTWGHAT